ncbi:hypothetical protein SAMN05660462_00219 [Proteiniborus ethanoligenes]|uniref:N-acetyltransferase domain-containing protein n=1 Tax=Proteiniborus ethanoligenes TaxID=415015 RepID=A0A1H3KKE8_9FIRM|nr:GNAT family N-acetyltransferase [Proteiniborus ethanoligenes]SDY52546.1 hypothetical protein SAMN05660462_00219 [Proteiniborus ethanoligenes]
MIIYKRCTEVDVDTIFRGFQIGFSDYIIKTEMPKDFFVKRFFGPEGNSYEHSIIALDGDEPVGLNLGGIKTYEGIKTLRCGALCIHPDYRGTEVGKKLFHLHKEIALNNGCKQMFLEVIVGNDRAINFYKSKGYEKVYDIFYYSHDNPLELEAFIPDTVSIREIDINTLRTLSHQITDIHINWQNDFDYIEKLEEQVHYGVFKSDKLMGGLSIHTRGKISFIWISPELRHQDIGKSLISYAVRELNIGKLMISFSNNANLLGFVKRLSFTKDLISQYEMYHTL